MRFINVLSHLLVTASVVTAAHQHSRTNKHAADIFRRADEVREKHFEAKRKAAAVKPVLPKQFEKRQSKFLNSKSQQFAVNGTGIPDVNFDVGESYAGLLPISQDPNETRKLFFWFFPSTNPAATSEVTAWFNGGPGCSSLSGLLSENGPFTWEAGTLAPVQNAYSWTNLTNMVWIEQPVGVGYSQGTPNITNEAELGEQLVGFWRNFIDTFGMQGYNTYLTGESYAGYYVPYIANAFINHADDTYYKLKGVSINDPIIGNGDVQQEVVVTAYTEYWQNVMYLNDTFMDQLRAKTDECGYTDYLSTYLAFPPPKGPFPAPYDSNSTNNYNCDIFDDVYGAALEVNPCFNIYHITDMCPHPWDVLGIVNDGDYSPPGEVVYFNRTDVKQAIHAPVNSSWYQCTPKNVFNYGYQNNYTIGDTSDPPATNGVLQRVIEYTNNTIIGSGNLDFLLSTNGTLLAIQNMTWNGAQGLQEYPGTPLYTPYHPEYNGGSLAGAGNLGYWGTERGLTFYQVQLSGHELPGYAPGAAYRMLEILLGRIDNFSNTSDFTTQKGNFTGNGTFY